MWKKLRALLKSTVGVSALHHEKSPARNKAGEIIEDHGDPRKKSYTLRCPVCNSLFRTQGREHIRYAKTRHGLMVNCPVCDEAFGFTVHDADD